MPLKVKKVTIPTIVASVLFNGTNQYLSIANTSTMQMGTSDYTVEAWIYPTANGQANGSNIFGQSAHGVSSQFIFGLTSANKIYNYIEYDAGGGSAGPIIIGATSITLNTWTHIATARVSGVTRIFINGVLDASASDAGGYRTVSHNFCIGSQNGYAPTFFAGYISNLRVVKGTALYTASFTAPTSPLTAIANTSLLTCNAATIVDGSSNNFAITNNNTATVSSTITPFIAASPGSMKFKKTSTNRIGRSVLFNGTNQYLSVASNAAFDFGTGSFTFETWTFPTSSSAGQALVSFANTNVFYLNSSRIPCYGIYLVSDAVIGSTAITLNTWSHIAFVRIGTTLTCYINGTSVGSITTAPSIGTSVTSNYIGSHQGANYWNGYLSNIRVVKGTALYTSSFTAPTAPLTAIANTSLLTCQSPTIIDNSSNNFAITNNNTATVSTTNPFGADTVSGTFKVKKSPAVYMTATGGDLITTSGSYKIHTFTTVGTSSFTISSVGSTPSIEYLIVGGGGAGGSNNNCGGGGAGGLIYNTASLSAGAYAVTIGQSGSVASGVSNGNNGGNSTFNGLIALGGGGGGGSTAGSNGGSGGGNGGGGFSGTGTVSAIGLQPTSSYGGFGNNGGASAGASSYPGGGGGGAGAAGNNGSGANGGNGGIGKAYAFAGALTYYAGGGGGSLNPGTPGTGGLGGGGNGVSSNPSAGANATGYGSGGGGGLSAGSGGVGGAGSPGIILIKYRYTD